MSRKRVSTDERLVIFNNVRVAIKDIIKLQEMAKAKNTTVSKLVRQSIKIFLENE